MKNKQFLAIAFLLLLIISCTSQKKTTVVENETTIIGIAEHAKMGAIVINKNGTYYILGKSNWDAEGFYKKEVQVTGILSTKTHNAQDLKNEKGEIMQGPTGEINYIKMSKCELTK